MRYHWYKILFMLYRFSLRVKRVFGIKASADELEDFEEEAH